MFRSAIAAAFMLASAQALAQDTVYLNHLPNGKVFMEVSEGQQPVAVCLEEDQPAKLLTKETCFTPIKLMQHKQTSAIYSIQISHKIQQVQLPKN